jgi:hypothetical protein
MRQSSVARVVRTRGIGCCVWVWRQRVWLVRQLGSCMLCVRLAPDLARLAACLLCCSAHAVTVVPMLVCGLGCESWWLCVHCFVCCVLVVMVWCGVVRLSACLPTCLPALPARVCSCCLALRFRLPASPLHCTAALLRRPCACLTVALPFFSPLLSFPAACQPCILRWTSRCRRRHPPSWETCFHASCVCLCLLHVTAWRVRACVPLPCVARCPLAV